jgi:hypothetical protein
MLLIAARFLTGMGACNAVTTRSYLARVTSPKTRTTAIAFQTGLQVGGRGMGADDLDVGAGF